MLEGITRANYKQVERNARALRELTENERWRVSPDISHTRYTAEFQQLTEAMEEAARERNIDGATLAHVNMTLTCVKCHKYIRDQKFTNLDPPTRLR